MQPSFDSHTLGQIVRRGVCARRGAGDLLGIVAVGACVAPLAGVIRRNDRHSPMHPYVGGRDPARVFYFDPKIQRWLGAERLRTVRAAFSRVPEGGDDEHGADHLRSLVAPGAIVRVRVCGGRATAHAATEALKAMLAPLHLNVLQLKACERYAEDYFWIDGVLQANHLARPDPGHALARLPGH